MRDEQNLGELFISQDQRFLSGVQMGSLLSRLMNTEEKVIEGLFRTDIHDEIMLAASRLGWVVRRVYGEDGCGVFYLRMRKIRRRRGKYRQKCPVHD